jgi:hypothetical protein
MNYVEVWENEVAAFAREHALPADEVLAGQPFVCGQWRFALQRSPQLDPRGLVVMMDLGEIPEATAARVQLEMLAHNARRPSALLGHLGILPGTNRALYCVRLDQEKTDEPAALIAATVQSLAASLSSSLGKLSSMSEALIRQ